MNQKLADKYHELETQYMELVKDSRALVNYILRIKKKCESEHLWLMASMDPHKELTTEQQQGPMVNKMFDLVQELKKKLK